MFGRLFVTCWLYEWLNIKNYFPIFSNAIEISSSITLRGRTSETQRFKTRDENSSSKNVVSRKY